MRKISVIATSLFLLSACGDSPAEKVQALLQQGQTNDALRLINETLQEDPNNAYLRAVSAKLLTDACVRDNCMAESPEALAAIRARLEGLPPRVTIVEGATYDVYGEVLKSARRLITQHNSIDGYLRFTREALPEQAPKEMFQHELRELIVNSITSSDPETTNRLLSLLASDVEADPDNVLALEARYLQALLGGNTAEIQQMIPTLGETVRNQPTMASDLLRMLPHLMLNAAKQEAAATGNDARAIFVRMAKTPFAILQLPDLNTPENIARVATDFERLSKDAAFADLLTQNTTPAEGVLDNALFTRLMVLKAGLVLEPSNAARWKAFFAPALENATAKASLRFLYDDIELSGMPAEVIIENNNLILGRMRQMLDAGENIVPVLREIIYRGDAQQLAFAEQTAQMLTGALDNALEQKDPSQILVYVGYDRKIANGREEAITTMMTNAIREQWERNDFTPIREWADFLTDTLRVPYSLDVQISDLLSEFLNSEDVQQAITGIHPRQLLQSPEEAKLDLGQKLAFAEEHFRDRADIIQAKLKTMALNAPGTYGTPLTLLRLRDHFNMPDWREQFTTALKVAINKDTETPVTELTTVGEQLVKMWSPGIVYNFIINELFTRAVRLEDIREVWKIASPEMRQNAETLRPQLAALMQAIDAYEANDLVTSAAKFGIISDQTYLAAAKTYVDAFADLIKPYLGSYAVSGSDDSNVGILRIEAGRDLLTARLTFTNAVGMLEKREEFIVNRGDVANLDVVGRFNPQTQEITVDAAARAGGVDGIGFERFVGDLQKIQLQDDGRLTLVTSEGSTEMRRMANAGERMPLPQGRFGITKQVTAHNAESDHVLPIGSILEFRTQDQITTQTISDGRGGSNDVGVFPVTGTVMHPSQRSPITLSGYFLPETNLLALTFSYPMNEGRTMLDAELRCQVLTDNIICAGQNRHWSRQRFTHVVRGLRARIDQQ